MRILLCAITLVGVLFLVSAATASALTQAITCTPAPYTKVVTVGGPVLYIQMVCTNAAVTPTLNPGQLQAFVLVNGKLATAPTGSYKYAAGTSGSTTYPAGTVVVQQNGLLIPYAKVPKMSTTSNPASDP
jgi:hypothetical protein